MSSTTSAISSALLGLALALVSACASVGADATPVMAPEPVALRHEQLDLATEVVLPCEQEFLTPAIRARESFFEALVSWNVEVPEGSGMTVELRVREEDELDWSPWLFVGEWGAVGTLPPQRTEFEDGRIDVDYFAGERSFRAIQLRFRALGRGALRIRRIDLCLTGAANTPVVSEAVAPDAVCLDVPLRSQRAETADLAARVCSPTCVAMALEYRGVTRTTREVAERLYDARHDIYGNWTRAIQGAFELGVPGYLARFSEWAEVEAMLANGQPLVVSVRTPEGGLTGAPYVSTEGHLLVIVGFDEAGNVIVNDPAAESVAGVRRVYLRDELERAWMGKGGVAYVFLRPE